MEKMKLLVDLPGIGAPVASTFLQFFYPSSFPIIDRRTVAVLCHFGYIQHKSTGIAQYPAFMAAVLAVRDCCPKWGLREIDRAVFAYHKQNTALFGTLSEPNTPGSYHRGCWTPRKIDKILWTYGREEDSSRIVEKRIVENLQDLKPQNIASPHGCEKELGMTNHEMIAAAVENHRGRDFVNSRDRKDRLRGFPSVLQGESSSE